MNGSVPDSAALILVVLIGFAMAFIWAFLFLSGCELMNRAAVRVGLSNRSKRIVGYTFGILFAAVVTAAVVDSSRNSPRPFSASLEVKSVVDGSTAFALDVYQQLKDRPANLFFSPYSIFTALAMTYGGARGPTETEMASAAHFGLPQEKLPAAYHELIARTDKIQRWNRITLIMANGLWLQQDYHFTQGFLDLVHTYRGEMRPADFKNGSAIASGKINSWVERKTKGRITGIVQPSQLTPETALILCNAIYFHWRLTGLMVEG